MNLQLFGGGSSTTQYEEKVAKREPGKMLIGKMIKHTTENVDALRADMMLQSAEIKLISINKLYTDQRSVSISAFEREKEREKDIIERRRDRKEQGIIDRKASDVSDPNDQPINVLKKDNRYIVLEGIERVIAKRALGVKKIKARVFDVNKGRQT